MRIRLTAVTALLALGLAACGGGSSASDKVACKNTKTIEASALLSSPPSGYEVEKLPQADAREILKEFPQETRAELSGVTALAATKGEAVVIIYALTSAKERLDPEEEIKGFRQTAEAEVEELEIAGQPGALQSMSDGTVAVGTAGDCGAVLIVAEKEPPVRDIAGALEAPKT